MLNKLREVKANFESIEARLALPETASDNALYKKLMRE